MLPATRKPDTLYMASEVWEAFCRWKPEVTPVESLTTEEAQRRFNPMAFRNERGPALTTRQERAALAAARTCSDDADPG